MAKTAPRSPAPPLVVRFGAFGDMVLLEPMLNVLCQRYGQPCDLVSSGPWTQALVRHVDSVRTTRILYSRSGPYLLNPDQWRLVRWLRRRPPGPVYVCETDDKVDALLRHGGCHPDWICTRRDFPPLPGEHYVQRYHRLASATPRAWSGPAPAAPPGPPPQNLRVDAATKADCARWLASQGIAGRPLVLVQPGNKRTTRWWLPRQRGSNVKYWPESRWAEVIRGVRDAVPQAAVLVCGSAAESRLARSIVSLAGDGAYSVADELPISRLLALQSQAHSMISVDTGPAHSAVALGCPIVVMYATASPPDLYAPYAPVADTQILTSPDGNQGQPLLGLSVGQVLSAWRSLRPRSP